ncbi:MAG: cytochrome c biogenesis protein CcsA [Anaerolineales bacterium]|nr:cytochrome c biogenesis protein CcsA [Anaerolineales bacterium]MBS3752976.1 cytochrome c biogenesis protein CcsA [Anaerolineales bacterium]
MEEKPRFLSLLDGITGILFLAAVLLVFFYAPLERSMGAVQKVFYFHVSTAWVGMLGFFVSALMGGMYILSRKKIWDMIGFSSVEISFIFFFIAIVSGSIWARPIWNTWWTWDPRLTTAAVVELIYGAYFLLRQAIDEPQQKARFSAVYAIFGFLSVPLTFVSIRMLRTIHPVVIGAGDPTGGGGFSMTGPMQVTFFFSLFTFSVLFVDVLWHRIRLEKLESMMNKLRLELTS